MKNQNNLCERLFDFGTNTILFTRKLPENTENKVIKYQLIKACTSCGANYEESQAGSSRADFCNKVRIALREMRESNYWLRVIKAITNKNNLHPELDSLINESEELKSILGSIILKTSGKHTDR